MVNLKEKALKLLIAIENRLNQIPALSKLQGTDLESIKAFVRKETKMIEAIQPELFVLHYKNDLCNDGVSTGFCIFDNYKDARLYLLEDFRSCLVSKSGLPDQELKENPQHNRTIEYVDKKIAEYRQIDFEDSKSNYISTTDDENNGLEEDTPFEHTYFEITKDGYYINADDGENCYQCELQTIHPDKINVKFFTTL